MRAQMTEEALMKAATFDDFEMEHRGEDGHICVVATQGGVKVCWECGEPFHEGVPKLSLIEKRPQGATVPVGVHYKCANVIKSTASPNILSKVAAGMREKRVAVRALAFADHLGKIAKSVKDKIIT